MSRKARRILICGFGPFPGVAVNPSGRAALRLAAARRPALADLRRKVHVLPTQWTSVGRVVALIRDEKPDVVLLLGIAPRRRVYCVETRAVNAASRAPDSARRHWPGRALDPHGGAERRTLLPVARLVADLRAAGLSARPSRDAGRYLCNATYHAALGAMARAGRPGAAVFVHLPGGARPHDAEAGLVRLLRTLAAARTV